MDDICSWCGSRNVKEDVGVFKCLDCDFVADTKEDKVFINIKSLLSEIKDKIIKLKGCDS